MKESSDTSERIEVNDLVWIKQSCPGCDCSILGAFFVVTKIEVQKKIRCHKVQPLFINETVAEGLYTTPGNIGATIPVRWLKKVPPIENLESFNTTKEKPIVQH